MPKFGGMSPFPMRLGGGRPRVQIALEQLTLDRGDAYDSSNTESVVYVENMALARAISAAWGTNERLGNIWVAVRMADDILERWENILGILPAPDATPTARRERVAEVFEQHGQPAINGLLAARLSEELGAAFVAIEYIPYSSALITVPDGTYPWGTTGAVPWSSTVAQVLVRLQKPSTWTEGEFYAAAALVALTLEPELPIWTTFDWYRAGTTSSAVSGGPSAAGFYLDDDNNLDNQIFD